MGLSLGGALGGSAIGGLAGGIFGSGAGSSLFGTKQGTVPYNNTSTFNPFAASYLPAAFTGAQDIFNANAQGTGMFGQAQKVANATISGDYLNPESNPYLRSSVQDALGLAGSSFAGQYGGAAGTNLGNSGYQEGLARTLGQIATNAYGNAYQQERANQLNAIPFAGSLPYANIAGYEAALAPGLSFGTTTGQNQQPYFTNQTSQTLGALTAGAGLYKMFG